MQRTRSTDSHAGDPLDRGADSSFVAEEADFLAAMNPEVESISEVSPKVTSSTDCLPTVETSGVEPSGFDELDDALLLALDIDYPTTTTETMTTTAPPPTTTSTTSGSDIAFSLDTDLVLDDAVLRLLEEIEARAALGEATQSLGDPAGATASGLPATQAALKSPPPRRVSLSKTPGDSARTTREKFASFDFPSPHM